MNQYKIDEDSHSSPDLFLPLPFTSPSNDTSSRDDNRSHSMKSRKNITSNNQILHETNTVPSTNSNIGDIIQLADGTRKKYNGSTWRRICSELDCSYYTQSKGVCKLHLNVLKHRHSLQHNIAKDNNNATSCTYGKLEDHNRLRENQYNESTSHKRRRRKSPPSMIPSRVPLISSIRSCPSKINHRLTIAAIPPSVDINNPKKGDIIEMENGSRKKFDGVVWRKICSLPNCLIAAQRDDLCRKHFIQLHGKPSNESTNDMFESVTMVKPLSKSISSMTTSSTDDKSEARISQSLYDGQMNFDDDNNEQDLAYGNMSNGYHALDDVYQEDHLDTSIDDSFITTLCTTGKQNLLTVHQSLSLFNGLCSRSVGIQCNPPTANQTTSTSPDMSSMTDDELIADRTIKIIRPSSPILKATNSTKRKSSQGFGLKQNIDAQHADVRDIVITSTCLDNDQMTRVNEFCARFNIKSSKTVDKYTTHLITDEDGETLVCPLSKKVIQAVARHMFITTYRWIDTCLEKNQIITEKPFEIQGDSTLSSDHHGMQRSRQSILPNILPKCSLFENFSIMLKCDGCQQMVNNDELIELVKLSGAKHTTDSYFSRVQTDIIRIVLCEKEYLINRKEMYEKCIHIGVHFLTPQWFIESLVQYRIQPYQDYQISP